MSKNHPGTNLAAALTVAVCAWAIGPGGAPAQVGPSRHKHESPARHNHGHGSAARAGSPPTAQRSVHGGQITVAGPLCFEVVYRPKETRVYLYGTDRRPMSARGVRGQVSMKVRGNEKVFRFPLRYAAPEAGSRGHDYVAVAVDVSRVRDGQMTVTFELANLPSARQPRVTFTQTFALSKIPVTVGLLDESDPPRIEQQEVCAVSGGRLGSMGTPIKALVDGQPIYLCCKGCLGKVEKNPAHYLAKAAELRAGR